MKMVIKAVLTTALLFVAGFAHAQFTIPNAQITGGTITGLSSPIPVASGGTGANASGATAANNIGALAQANNLSDVASVSTARTNLGLGSMATQGATAVAITGGSISGTSISGSTGSFSGSAAITGAATTNRAVTYQTAGSPRWWAQTSSEGETGSNAGTNYLICRASDSGSYIDCPVTIVRATGVAQFSDGIQVSGASVLPNLSATTGSIGGSSLAAGACTSGTVAVSNSTTSMAVAATPSTYPGDGFYWRGYVSAAGTVTVKVCAVVAATPTASTFNVRVLQ